ncbi:hypothetical protein HUW86_09550 [Fusobacterium sp. SB021]|uniref:hypothetical protein n=1 Tax=Fusobacterium sp. SB021 TaxID=2744227 RepID=UPI003CF3D80E
MEEKEILMLFIKEAEERNIFKSKSNTMQEQVIDLINEFVEKNKDDQEVMDWLFELEVKILEMGEAFKQDYFQLGTIAQNLKVEQEELKKEKTKE